MPTSIAKNWKGIIVWCGFKKTFNKSVKIDNFTWQHVDKKSGIKESFIPKFERHRSMSKQGKANFNNVTMFAFS
jgi:hypothetical protein